MASSQTSSEHANLNGKRPADEGNTPAAKKGKHEKDQKTIEETMEVVSDSHKELKSNDEHDQGRVKSRQPGSNSDERSPGNGDEDEPKIQGNASSNNQPSTSGAQENSDKQSGKDSSTDSNENTASDEKSADTAPNDEGAKGAANGSSVGDQSSILQDKAREEAMPSSILEKGIIYFFFRGRVGVEDPKSVDDIARSFIVLRPLPIGAKIGEGALEDTGNARLLSLPKKVLPKSQNDRFLMFVDKPRSSIKDLKENFVSGSDYATRTAGTSHSPAATPIAEGIYVITSTGRDSHLAYHITAPELGEVQKDIGINEKGSYVLSVKNPTASGPANATLDHGAEYPKELMNKFRGLRWTPLEPAHLDYERTQFLIIGEGMGSTETATKAQEDGKKDGKEQAEDEMKKLEEEESHRVESLKADDAIFADLGLSSRDYPKMQTTW